MSPGTLEAQIEEAALDLFVDLGWETARVMDESFGDNGTLGRETKGDVVLLQRLRPALEKLNPKLPPDAIDQAVDLLTRDRSAMGSIVAASRDVYALLKQGVKVRVPAPDGDEGLQDVTVRVIDWEKVRDILPRLEALFADSDMATLRDGTRARFEHGRGLQQMMREHGLEPLLGDDLILAAVLRLHEQGDPVTVVTDDTGVRLRARGLGLAVRPMPETVPRRLPLASCFCAAANRWSAYFKKISAKTGVEYWLGCRVEFVQS